MQYQNLIFFALLVGVFWFVILRPQQQRQKQHRDMLEMLSAGDEIVTLGGIYATVVEVGERVRVAVADGSELEIARQAVAQIVATASESDDAQDDTGVSEPDELPTESRQGTDDADA